MQRCVAADLDVTTRVVQGSEARGDPAAQVMGGDAGGTDRMLATCEVYDPRTNVRGQERGAAVVRAPA